MKHWVLFLSLILSVSFVHAQSDQPSVRQLFTGNAPLDYVTTYSIVTWSPNGALIAIRFNKVNEGNSPTEALWQLYNVETGELLQEFTEWVAWYSDSSRVLVRMDNDAFPSILDVQAGLIGASLEAAGTNFLDEPIEDVIVNLDDMNTLRIYDAETGLMRFSLDSVADLPVYSSDGTYFAVNVSDSGIQVYNAQDFSPLYTLDGYQMSEQQGNTWSSNGEQLAVMPLDSLNRQLGPRHIWTLGEGLSEPIYNMTSTLVWSPDGTRVAAASDFTKVRIYDSTTGELLETIRGYADGPTGLLRWEGHYLSAQSGDYAFVPPLALSVWDFGRAEFIFKSVVDIGYDYWFEGGEMVIFEPFIGTRHISLDNGEPTQTVEFERTLSYPSPDHQWIIGTESPFETGVPAPISVYRFNPLEFITTLDGHTDIVRSILWSPDNRHFASIGGPNTVIVWELLNGTDGDG